MKLKKRKFAFIVLMMFSTGILYFNMERIQAEIKSYFQFLAPTISLPSPTWNNVERKFLDSARNYVQSENNIENSMNSGCSLPKLDPFDPSILPYISQSPPPIKCSSNQLPVLFIVKNTLNVNTSALQEHGYQGLRDVHCSYKYIDLPSTDEYSLSEEHVITEEKTVLSSAHNGILAKCTRRSLSWFDVDMIPAKLLQFTGVVIYQNILIYVPRLKLAEKIEKSNTSSIQNKFSVVILIIDALSQQGFIRNLPKTKSYLDTRNGILFSGHHKNGHNSYPNVMAIVSGELGGPYPPFRNGTTYYLDEQRQTIIQTVYKNNGYITAQMEDFQIYGTFGRRGEVGLRQAPTNIFYRAPFLAMAKEGLQNTLVGKCCAYACLQEQMLHKHQFRIIHDFISMYAEDPSFMFMHFCEYSHNDLNMAKHYDQDLKELMEEMIDKNELKDTFFMILGDHGFQRAEDKFVLTEQGRIENSLPALYLLPPPHFAENYSEMHKNLVKNSQRLTSFWDLNQMLRQLLSLSVNKSQEELFPKYEGHGISLLEDVGDRNCEEAEISENYCQCTDGISEMSADESEVWAQKILLDTNNFLQPFDFCQKLSLKTVIDASSKFLNKVLSIRVQFEVRTGAMFEGSYSWNTEQHQLNNDKLVRLDWYSDTSRCVPNNLAFIRPYCIC